MGIPAGVEVLAWYGRALEPLAAAEVAAVPMPSWEDAVEFVVMGTALYEPMLLALLRLAQQDASMRRFSAD